MVKTTNNGKFLFSTSMKVLARLWSNLIYTTLRARGCIVVQFGEMGTLGDENRHNSVKMKTIWHNLSIISEYRWCTYFLFLVIMIFSLLGFSLHIWKPKNNLICNAYGVKTQLTGNNNERNSPFKRKSLLRANYYYQFSIGIVFQGCAN